MGFLQKLGGTLKQGGRYVNYNLRVKKERESLKYDILDLFDYNEIKQMCSFYDVGKPDPKEMDENLEWVHYKPNQEDWNDHAMYNVSLEEMEEYAKKKRKNIRPILEKKQHLIENRMKDYPEYEKPEEKETPDEFVSEEPDVDSINIGPIIRAIQEFEPARMYKNEFGYHIELVGWLKREFPDAEIEFQQGRSRPDIVIGDVAIEVKGPTRRKDLEKIADKCYRYLRYHQHLIIVLFELDVDGERYSEWSQGLKETHKHRISIIPK